MNTLSEADKPVRSAPIKLEDCGLAATAQLLGDKWTLLILREIFYGVTRFADIQNDIGIPKAVLSTRLNHLLEIDVLCRKQYQETNARPRFEYKLTSSGSELAIPLISMMLWGDKHQKNGKTKVQIVEKTTRRPLTLALVDLATPKTPLTEISLEFK